METITVKGLTFGVEIEHDQTHGAPWQEEDGHGYVTNWETRGKQPGELVLCEDRGHKKFYDFAGAVALARKDGWGVEGMAREDYTPGEIAEAAARADYENLRRYCAGDWSYVCVLVTLLDVDGRRTHENDAIGGVCSNDGDYMETLARELARGIADRVGRRKTLSTTIRIRN